MPRNVWNDICELANRTTQQLCKVSTPCIDDHHFKEEEMKSVGELSHVCSHIVLKCLYLARIGRPDILWSVNKLARSITKWTKACDKRLNRLISYIHHTCEYKQYCHVGNTAKQCRLGLFQDSDFAGDLEDSKSTSGGTLCIFGSHTFLPRSWMCKKQTAVSHSSTESEIISLDTGLRLDGLPALELWDLIVSVLGNVSRVSDRSGQPDNDGHKHHKLHKKINVMKDIDAVPSNVQSAFTRTCVAQVTSLACAQHIPCVISMRSCCVFDSLRLLHFLLFAVHLLSYHPVFPPGHQLHLPRCGGQIPCALLLMRTLALLPSTTLSQVISPTSTTPRRLLNHTSRNPRSRMGPSMTSSTMTSPSAWRSLHRCSPRSEKMMRAVDELITLKTKVCPPVSRRLSVMIERRDPL